MAPSPWTPPVRALPDRYRRYRRILPEERQGRVQVTHPRFFVFPKVAKPTDGWMMAASCLPAARRLRRDFAFDIVDSHWAAPDGVAAVILARKLGVPAAVTVRGDDINVFGQEPGRRKVIGWALGRAAHRARDRALRGSQTRKVHRGFCHQEAPQAHGEEEAPQAAEEDARPASQARQVRAGAPLGSQPRP